MSLFRLRVFCTMLVVVTVVDSSENFQPSHYLDIKWQAISITSTNYYQNLGKHHLSTAQCAIQRTPTLHPLREGNKSQIKSRPQDECPKRRRIPFPSSIHASAAAATQFAAMEVNGYAYAMQDNLAPGPPAEVKFSFWLVRLDSLCVLTAAIGR
jgi:hypothetical protein